MSSTLDERWPSLTDAEIRAMGYEPTKDGWMPLPKSNRPTVEQPSPEELAARTLKGTLLAERAGPVALYRGRDLSAILEAEEARRVVKKARDIGLVYRPEAW